MVGFELKLDDAFQIATTLSSSATSHHIRRLSICSPVNFIPLQYLHLHLPSLDHFQLPNSDMADTTSAPAPPAFKKRTNKSTARKRPATPPPADSDSESASDASSNDENGVRVKRRKREGLTTNTSAIQKPAQDLSKATKFGADRSTTLSNSNDATKSSTWYTDAALAGENGAQQKDAVVEEGQEGLYKGASSGYGSFIQKSANAAEKRQVGPVKAPTNVRAITVTDFAPDVCKDYKQTGFCGFGDSCKFLHAREDYKQGWQLDKEWEKAGRAEKAGTAKKEDEGLDEEEKLLKEIPFKCVICKGDYKMPVVTKCGHYFCEKCAMQRYMKEKKKGCAMCGADTRGSFGVAKKLKGLLERKEKREEERAEKEAEADG